VIRYDKYTISTMHVEAVVRLKRK